MSKAFPARRRALYKPKGTADWDRPKISPTIDQASLKKAEESILFEKLLAVVSCKYCSLRLTPSDAVCEGCGATK